MIFQIDYHSGGRFDSYFELNNGFYDSLDYKLYDNKGIDIFLREHGHYDLFHSKEVFEPVRHAENAIRCDLLRLLILYEFGGVYVDADVTFTNKIVTLENDLEERYGNRNVVLLNRSLYFMKGVRKSNYINYLLDIYKGSEFLHVDVEMNKRHELSKFHKELMVVPNEVLSGYFTHRPDTTVYDY